MFGLVKKSVFLSNLVQLLGANGVDFKQIIIKTRSTSEAKAKEALMIKNQAAEEAESAKAEYEKVVSSAQSALDLANNAVNTKIQSAVQIEAEALALAKSADYFSI